jgi:uncharacterized protein
LGYIAPFAVLLLLIALPKSQVFTYWEWPVQVLIVGTVCFLTWPSGALLRLHRPLATVIVGIAVFVLWIAPEAINPHYREGVLFSNSILGHVGSSLLPEALRSKSVLFWRTMRASTVVPIAEELFWRAWLMRWLINNDFQKIPLGTYAPAAFWLTAILFAAEHGPYWDVGLLTGVIYNFWMLRTKSLGDCVLAHAVTNLLMSLYVIKYAQWQYWQ